MLDFSPKVEKKLINETEMKKENGEYTFEAKPEAKPDTVAEEEKKKD